MIESRNRSRKVMRKAGPPESAQEQKETNPSSGAQGNQGSTPTSATQKPRQNSGSDTRDATVKTDGGEEDTRRTASGAASGSKKKGGRGGRPVLHSMQGADLTQPLPAPPRAPKGGLRIIALGGISEIGRNMTVFEYNKRIVIIDCGVLFPSSGEPGVDLILPDFAYLESRLDQIEALVVTHGHEDHIGAIPWLLKLKPDLEILASTFTAALISAKCREHRQQPKLTIIDHTSREKRGPFDLRFFTVNHSIPDCLGVALKTAAGLVLHTGDIKLDQTPPDGRPTDLPAISRFGDEGVDLFLCDSTNATTPGISGSEAAIAPTLKRLVAEASQRVIIASFASNVYRVQAAVDAAVAAGRKVAFNGRSMIRNMEIAEKLGYLKAPRGTIVSMDEAGRLAPHKVVLITTGTQGEPMAALSRMARREHRQITVRDGDLIVLSSSLVPGNEEAVFGVINMLAQIGATVITGRDATVHTSGHGYSGELLFLYNAARPRNAMPVHGEWRHLRANKELAVSTGVERDRVVLAQNGVVVDLAAGRAQVVGQIPVGNLYVDGVTMGDVDAEVLADRTSLGEGGLITITAVVDNRSGYLLQTPQVQTKGFSEESSAMMRLVTEVVENTMTDLAGEGEGDPYRVVQKLRRVVSRFVEKKWRRQPMIVPTVIPMRADAMVADDDDIRRTRESL